MSAEVPPELGKKKTSRGHPSDLLMAVAGFAVPAPVLSDRARCYRGISGGGFGLEAQVAVESLHIAGDTLLP